MFTSNKSRPSLSNPGTKLANFSPGNFSNLSSFQSCKSANPGYFSTVGVPTNKYNCYF